MAKPVAVLTDEYVSPARAIQMLGKSERSIQRLAEAGELRWKLEGRGRRYHAGDLLRIGEEGVRTSRKETTALTPRPKTESAMVRTPAMAVPIAEKLWLTVEEAQALTGFARNDLLKLCREGKLTARRSGGWRIRRVSLEEFGG